MLSADALPQNLTIIDPAPTQQVAKTLFAKQGVQSFYVTNGIYALPASLVVPTTLGGFEHAIDAEKKRLGAAAPTPHLLIVVNSDKSVALIYEQKKQKPGLSVEEVSKIDAEKDSILAQTQLVRATRVAEPLARQHPDLKVSVAFFDGQTPNTFFNSCAAEKVNLDILFKFGYGTDPNQGIIEGIEYFSQAVYAYPFPNNAQPLCHDVTKRPEDDDAFEANAKKIRVFRLTAPADNPYMTCDNKVCFKVNHASLEQYQSSTLCSAEDNLASSPSTKKLTFVRK